MDYKTLAYKGQSFLEKSKFQLSTGKICDAHFWLIFKMHPGVELEMDSPIKIVKSLQNNEVDFALPFYPKNESRKNWFNTKQIVLSWATWKKILPKKRKIEAILENRPLLFREMVLEHANYGSVSSSNKI